jgi:signal transduction histidine kinase
MTDSHRLTELNNATQALAATTDFASTLRATLHLAAQLAQADSAWLVLFNKTTQAWFVHSTLGPVTDTEGQEAVTVAQTGQAAVADDSVALPLRVKGRVVGALRVRRAGLVEEDRTALEIFAASAALAIDSTLSKTDFVSTVTHELRLPMTSIKGYSDLIRGGMAGPVSDMQKQLLETVRVNVDWMNALVSDLGDIAKVETGRLKVDLEVVDVGGCVQEAVTGMQAQFDSRSQTVSIEVTDAPTVYADRKRLIQMLTYLLTNANRYTPDHGRIEIRAAAAGSFVRFSVSDNGIGMKPEDKAKVFGQFFRSEDPVIRDHKGWGLALHLVKQLTGLLGGEVGVESDYGKGSTFWFTIPVAGSKQ